MAQWADFIPETIRLCPSAPRVVALTQIREAAIEFYAKSRVWRVDLPPQAVTAPATLVEIATPANTSLVDLLTAKWNGRKLTVLSRDEMDDERQGWQSLLPADTPETAFMTGTNSLRLVPQVSASGTLELYGALKPTRTATGIADRDFDDYSEVIAKGAAYRLLMMPEKSWTNFDLAAERRGEFLDGVRKARGLAKRGFRRSRVIYAPAQRYGGL